MKRFFYPRLAFINLKNHGKTFLPYIISSIFTVSMFYILHSLSQNDDLLLLKGGASLQMMLSFGVIVVVIFACIFIFYINSFLIKRRKKEIGLYNILGMEKKHIMGMLLYENIYTIILSIGLGLLFGLIFSKLLFLILLNLVGFTNTIQFQFSISSLIITLLVFIPIFLCTLLFNMFQIHTTNPASLLKGGNVGEKEPKTKWILTVIGIACLIVGYYIALTITHPLQAFSMFFIAVILVIVATYAIFISVSIAVLKILKKKKRFYYQTKHFTVVSGMIYRMKQNAVGLASICILSTCIIVMLSTTICLYVGSEDLLNTMYPYDISANREVIIGEDIDTQRLQTESTLKELALQNRVTMVDENAFQYGFVVGEYIDSVFTTTTSDVMTEGTAIYFITVDDYNAMSNTDLTLASNEVYISTPDANEVVTDTVQILDTTFQYKDKLPNVKLISSTNDLISTCTIIFNDTDTIDAVVSDFNKANTSNRKILYQYVYMFNLEGESENQEAFFKDLTTSNSQSDMPYSLTLKTEKEESFTNVYGGFLFIGIFLGIQFLIATTLIIYYKQISEGYDDKNRYEIMKKVGMSEQEVKSSIHFQVLLVFFLPLIMACIHYGFAFQMMTKLLALFQLTNVTLFLICSVITIAAFALFYSIVYFFTSKAYYKIVK